MADYIKKTEVITRTVFQLTLPTNWVEIDKVIAACRNHIAPLPSYDDSVIVESDDETLRFVIKEPGRTSLEL